MKTGFAAGYKEVDEVLKDGDVLPYLGGIEVIYTPGHTIGHMCLYLRESKTLIAGDLLFYREGKLSKADSSINHDQDLVLKSLKKLTQYDIENIICYHGGLFNDNANESIKKLI
jgi:glyoxylase-like metal-dependent hydrolase (beta-lactamase superfamily II)